MASTAKTVCPPKDRMGLKTPFFKHVWIKLFQRRPQKSVGEEQCCNGASDMGWVEYPVNIIVDTANPAEHVDR